MKDPYLSKLDKDFNNDFYYCLITGEICVSLGRNIEGINFLEKSLKLIGTESITDDRINTYYLRIYSGIGQGYLNEGKLNKALKYYLDSQNYINSKIEEIVKKSYKIYKNIGLIYYDLKNYKEALQYYKKALQSNENAIVRLFLADTQFKLNMYQKAEKNYLQIYDKTNNKEALLIYYRLIKIYTRTNNNKKSFEYLLKATRKDLEFYRLYDSSDKEELINDAVKKKYINYLKQNYKNFKKNNKIRLIGLIIYTLLKLNKDKTAREYINILKEQYSQHIETYYWQCVLFLRKGNYKKAKTLFKESVKKHPKILEEYKWKEVNLKREKIKEILS